MADQKTTIKVSADLSDLEKSFAGTIRKLQADMDKMKLSPTASKAASGTSSIDAARDKMARDVALKQEEAKLKVLKEQYNTILQITREEEKLNRQRFLANVQQKQFFPAVGAQSRPISGGQWGPTSFGNPPIPPRTPPVGPAGPGWQMPKGGITGISSVFPEAAGAMATVAAATAAVESTRRFFAEASNRARVAESSAFNIQGQGGQRLESFMNGGASEELMFNSQRLQAAQIAKKTVDARYDITALGLNPTALGLSVLRHPIANLERLGGALGFSSLGREFEANKLIEQGNEQRAQFEALKNGPEGKLRTATSDKYLRDWQRNLAFERQTGLSEGGFRGAYLGGIHSAGFNDEQGMGMTSAILGAGGSTRAATGNSAFALQMQRAFDLTNAGQAIGAISGQLGSSQMSKEALIKIQAEGTRIGVNQSDFREENRKFVEMAANIIGQSTATSGSGVEQLVDTLSGFMGSKTISGMQAGQSAYEAYQRQSNTQSGPSAAMRAAGMMKNPILRKLSGEDQAALFTMSQADVNVDDLGIQAMARKTGVSPQEFVDAYHGVQNSSLFNRKSSDMAISKVTEAYQKYGKGSKEAMEAEGEALNKMPLEEAGAGLGRKGQLALLQARASGDTREQARLLEEGVRSGAATGQTGRPGDDQERVQAQAARLSNELFNQIKDSITPAANAAREFANDINALTLALSKGTMAQKQKAIEDFQNSHPGMMPTNQPSTGPMSNGAGH